MSAKIRSLVENYYDNLLSKIDIQTESILASTGITESTKNDLNQKRQLLVDQIKSTLNSTLEKLKTTDDLTDVISNELKFLIYLPAPGSPGVRSLRSTKKAQTIQEPKLGKLIQVNRYVPEKTLECLNTLNDAWQKKETTKVGTLDQSKLNALIILSLIHKNESDSSIIPIDFDLTKIESLTFNSEQNLLAEKFDFLKFSQIRTIDTSHLTNLKKLIIYDQQIKKLSDSFLNPSLKELEILDNRIDKIDENVFVNCIGLTHLNLSQNGLVNLSQDSFNGLNFLEFLDLSNNAFETLNENCFSKLLNLKELNLSSNQLKFINKTHLNGLEKLETLRLECNSIEKIDKNAFDRLKNLTNLNLESNQLKSIDFKTTSLHLLNLDKNYFENKIDLSQFENLEILSFNHNKFKYLSLKKLNNLKSLSLITCGIESLEDDTFSDMSKLVELKLNFNQIKHLNKSLRPLKNLESLHLWSNEISDLNECFQGLSNLKVLRLKENQIKKLKRDDIKDLINLNEFNLSKNLIETIDEGVFDDLNNLNELNLSNNQINSFVDLVKLKEKIKNLDVSNNNL